MQSRGQTAGAVLADKRRNWFQTEMRNNRLAFTNDKSLLLLAGTWNVNGRPPDPQVDISPWLCPPSLHPDRTVDVYMIALEEVQPLSGVDAVRTDPTRGSAWRHSICAVLGDDFDLVADRQLVGILLFVFVRKNHAPFLSGVQLSYAATGFLNAGNKGAVAARFVLYDRSIACVASHLAAHTANVERRNQDFTDVVRKAVFMPDNGDQSLSTSQSSSALSPSEEFPQPVVRKHLTEPPQQALANSAAFPSSFPAVAAGTTAWLGSFASVAATAFSDFSAGANTAVLNHPDAINLLDHDVVFWLGDLNYRIEATRQHVLECISTGEWDALYQFDQLQQQMKICQIFSGFKEGPLRFPPTYKFELYSDEYACDESGEVRRVPAYTDRILWRAGFNKDEPSGVPQVTLEEYSSASSVHSSDHRPVYASFSMKFGVEDVPRRLSIEERVNKELDERQARYKPNLQVSSPLVDFGDVFFERQCERTATIRNVGSVTAFISISVQDESAKWFHFNASDWQDIEVVPGKSIAVRMRALVISDGGLANMLATHGCALLATLVITAEPGHLRERICVRGRYVATTLGLSLETLVSLAEPVLSLRKRTKDSSSALRRVDTEQTHDPKIVPLAIPKEIWLLVDALLREDEEGVAYMTKFPSLFLAKADEAQIQRVTAFIDHGEAVPIELSGDAVGMCLLRMLEQMHGPVIPEHAYKRAVDVGHREAPEDVQVVVDMIAPLNANVFWYLVAFLCELPVIQRREESGWAVVGEFANVMLRCEERDKRGRDEQGRKGFVKLAILHQQAKVRAYPHSGHTVVIDLGDPENHPRRFTKKFVEGSLDHLNVLVQNDQARRSLRGGPLER